MITWIGNRGHYFLEKTKQNPQSQKPTKPQNPHQTIQNKTTEKLTNPKPKQTEDTKSFAGAVTSDESESFESGRLIVFRETFKALI